MSYTEDIERRMRASFPFIYVVAREEARAVDETLRLARKMKRATKLWTNTRGWGSNLDDPIANELADFATAIREINKQARNAASDNQQMVNVLVNVHRYVDEPDVIQLIKDALPVSKKKGLVNIFICNVYKLPPELVDDVSVVDFSLPDRENIALVLDEALRNVGGKIALENGAKDAAIEAALGMTVFEAENAFALSLVEKRTVDPEVVSREKARAVAKSGLLEFYPPLPDGMKGVGGLENLKAWLANRRSAFTKKARDFGLEEPRGILLVGVPGCGKSLSAKAISAEWGLPLIKFDIGKLFGSLVGASEENTRRALATVEAVAPCVCWIDEIEKGMAGLGSSGSLDSGVSSRVFGTILSWMQERKRPVFVMATANQVQNLPPELLRAGRFDEVFAVDLPTSEERRAILVIHLAKRKRDPAKYDLAALTAALESFSGAEIEAVVKKALYLAFGRDRDLENTDILEAAKATVPLSVTKAEEIAALREWAKTRALPAGKGETVAIGKVQRFIQLS